MAVTLDLFWTEYTAFDNMIGSYDTDEFIWKSKDISDGNGQLWHQKYSFPFTKVLGFVACIVTSKVLGFGAAERSWGDVKTIKSGKYLILAVMCHRNILLFIHTHVLNQLELNNIIQTNKFMTIVQVIPGMKRMTHLIASWINGVWSEYFQKIQNLLKES